MTETLFAALTALHFQMTPVHDYNISGRAESQNGGVHVVSLTARDGNIDIKATISEFENESQAERSKKDKINRLQAVYDDHPEQYFAMVTRKTECPKEYKIESGVTGRMEWMKMFANSRNVLGACAADIAVKRVQSVFLVCGKTLLELSKFIPRKDWKKSEEDEMTSISCRI